MAWRLSKSGSAGAARRSRYGQRLPQERQIHLCLLSLNVDSRQDGVFASRHRRDALGERGKHHRPSDQLLAQGRRSRIDGGANSCKLLSVGVRLVRLVDETPLQFFSPGQERLRRRGAEARHHGKLQGGHVGRSVNAEGSKSCLARRADAVDLVVPTKEPTDMKVHLVLARAALALLFSQPLLSIAQTSGSPAPTRVLSLSAPQKWQYDHAMICKTEEVDASQYPKMIISSLNSRGAQGYELVNVLSYPVPAGSKSEVCIYAVFKRPGR